MKDPVEGANIVDRFAMIDCLAKQILIHVGHGLAVGVASPRIAE